MTSTCRSVRNDDTTNGATDLTGGRLAEAQSLHPEGDTTRRDKTMCGTYPVVLQGVCVGVSKEPELAASATDFAADTHVHTDVHGGFDVEK